MRCLTLADSLVEQGAKCHFIGRRHDGNLLDEIRRRGFTVTALPEPNSASALNGDLPVSHAAWLGCDWRVDAEQTREAITDKRIDWLVLDHYALDARWERALSDTYKSLAVIDDLADRIHECDLLIDQNLGRAASDYDGLVPAHSQLLIGPRFSLLRPEFASMREYSLSRRIALTSARKLLITMGGIDQPNATGQVLKALQACRLPADCDITVVMGTHAPSLSQVKELAKAMPWPTQVLVNVSNMAQLMAESDLVIGASGGTSWERCCLGLPTILVVLANNQWTGGRALANAKAAYLLGAVSDIERLPAILAELLDNGIYSAMSKAASQVTDGLGTARVVQAMANHNATNF